MSLFSRLAREIWRDHVTEGVPVSGAHEPVKSHIRQYGLELEAAIAAQIDAAGGNLYDTLSALNADLAHAANSQAWVYADTTAGNNGVYRKSGASGSGSWARVLNLPYAIIPLTVTGGTGNAIVTTSSLPIPTDDRTVLISLVPTADSTGAVTLANNGAAAIDVLDGTGAALITGALAEGHAVLGMMVDGDLRLIGESDLAASVAAAAASASAAAASAAAADASADSVDLGALDDAVASTAADRAIVEAHVTAALSPDNYSAMTPIKTLIERNTTDVTIVFVGDSTGDATNEWIYLFAEWLASEYPTHTVEYQVHDGTSYGSVTTIATGSGSYTIEIFNAAVSGYRLAQWQGARFTSAVVTPGPDLVITNAGINRLGLASARLVRMEALEFIQQVWDFIGSIPVVVHLQNPQRDDNTLDPVIEGLRGALEKLPDVGVVDTHTVWQRAGKPSGWYSDGTHPNATGSGIIADTWKAAWRAAQTLPALNAYRSWWADHFHFNVLNNGDFSAFASALPDNWTEGGTGTVSKETTSPIYTGKSYSVKIESTSAKYIRHAITTGRLNALKGRKITAAVRLYPVSGGHASTGQLLVQSDGTNAISRSTLDNSIYSLDGWVWKVIDDLLVPRDASYLYVNVYGAAAAGTVYVDEVLVYVGDGRPDYAMLSQDVGEFATLRASADSGGKSGFVTIPNAQDVTANSSGVGTILMKGTTSRSSAGFQKVYIGTTAYYVPLFSSITG